MSEVDTDLLRVKKKKKNQVFIEEKNDNTYWGFIHLLVFNKNEASSALYFMK